MDGIWAAIHGLEAKIIAAIATEKRSLFTGISIVLVELIVNIPKRGKAFLVRQAALSPLGHIVKIQGAACWGGI